MVNVIIIHGSYGNPEENWFPWLKKELEKLYCKVLIPRFPTPKNQNLENWLEVFKDYEKYLDENSIVVGHSLGPAFILSVLEKLNKPVKAAFFVSGFLGKLNNKKFDKINKTFTCKKFKWNKIKQNCKAFYLYHSDNDPYVPLEKAKELAKKLGTEVEITEGAGHFNEKSGYTQFKALLADIKRFL